MQPSAATTTKQTIPSPIPATAPRAREKRVWRALLGLLVAHQGQQDGQHHPKGRGYPCSWSGRPDLKSPCAAGKI